MKKSLLALAVLGTCAGTAYADDGVFHWTNNDTTLDFYGVLDAAEVSQNHGYSFNSSFPNNSYTYQGKIFATAPSQTGLINGGLSDSRLGLKGSTGLPGDMKAIFDLESGFDITTMKLNNAAQTLANNPSPSGTLGSANFPTSAYGDSSVNGQLFNRAAWIGVQANWGTVTYGTQFNPVADVLVAYDPVKSDTFSPFGESGTSGGGFGASEEKRMHHSLKYVNKFGNGFEAGVAYQWGDDWSTSYGDAYAARIGYDNGTWGVSAAYGNAKDAIVAVGSGGAVGTLKINVYDIDGYVLAGKYKFSDVARITGGYEHFERKTPSDAVQSIGSIWGFPVTATTPGSHFGAGSSQAYNIYFAGGDYDFTPDLNLALGYYNTKADALSNPATPPGNTEYTVGTWSTVLKYKYTKMLDLYAAATDNNYGGDVYSGTTYATNVSVYGVGARFKF